MKFLLILGHYLLLDFAYGVFFLFDMYHFKVLFKICFKMFSDSVTKDKVIP